MLVLILFIIFVVLTYIKLFKPRNYWKKAGVPQFPKPWPILGDIVPNFFGKRAYIHMVDDFYKAFPDKRYFGIYQFMDPVLVIRDPELIKKVTVKDFDVFPDRRAFATKDLDPLWSSSVLQLTYDDGWQDMRATLSPSFTSSKMKMMFGMIKECSEQFTRHFQKEQGTVTVELRDTFSRWATDVIGSTAFGVTCNSMDNPNNEFCLMGQNVTTFTGFGKKMRFFGHSISPALMKLLKIKIFDKEVADFFSNLVKETIKVRQEKGIIRPDMIHLLMEARKGRLKFEEKESVIDTSFAVVEESHIGKNQKRRKTELSDDDITAQVLLFFSAGFHSASSVLCFTSYELALNPDIQNKLREEIEETIKNFSGKLTYEGLLGMKYLDAVVSESLRRWPPGAFANRISTKPYVIEPKLPGEERVYLVPGTLLWIPFYPIHMDPKYYTNPEKFDPERFNDENKKNIAPFTFTPFGTGPRNCIGSRFALLEIKTMLAELLTKFEIVPVEKTQIPLELSKTNFNPMPDGGFWLGLKPR